MRRPGLAGPLSRPLACPSTRPSPGNRGLEYELCQSVGASVGRSSGGLMGPWAALSIGCSVGGSRFAHSRLIGTYLVSSCQVVVAPRPRRCARPCGCLAVGFALAASCSLVGRIAAPGFLVGRVLDFSLAQSLFLGGRCLYACTLLPRRCALLAVSCAHMLGWPCRWCLVGRVVLLCRPFARSDSRWPHRCSSLAALLFLCGRIWVQPPRRLCSCFLLPASFFLVSKGPPCAQHLGLVPSSSSVASSFLDGFGLCARLLVGRIVDLPLTARLVLVGRLLGPRLLVSCKGVPRWPVLAAAALLTASLATRLLHHCSILRRVCA